MLEVAQGTSRGDAASCLNPTLVFLKAAASCFIVLCNFNLRPPVVVGETVGVFSIPPQPWCKLKGKYRVRHKDGVAVYLLRRDQPCQ